MGVKTKKKGRKAREYCRTREGILPMAVCLGADDGLGLEAMSALWKYGDGEVGILSPQTVVFERAPRGKGTTSSMPSVPEELFGDIAVAETGQLVCPGSPSLCYRPLATWGDIVATDGRVVALLAGKTRTLFALATVG